MRAEVQTWKKDSSMKKSTHAWWQKKRSVDKTNLFDKKKKKKSLSETKI